MTLPVSFELLAAGAGGDPSRRIAGGSFTLAYQYSSFTIKLDVDLEYKRFRQDTITIMLEGYAPHEHSRVGAKLTVQDIMGVNVGHLEDWTHPVAPDSLRITPLQLAWRGIGPAWLRTHTLYPPTLQAAA